MRYFNSSLLGALSAVIISLSVLVGPGTVSAGEEVADISTAALKIPPQKSNGDVLQLAHSSMSRLGNETIAALSKKTLSKDERVEFYRKLITGNLDVKVLAKFMVGDAWKTMSSESHKAYLSVFNDFIVKTYATRLGGIEIEKFEIKETKFSGKDKKDVLVKSKISRPGDRSVDAVWRLRSRGDRFVILDLSVQGISVALTMRQEFVGIIQKTGSIDGLIDVLKKRVV
ncbi:MAG: ABC transporter substrate-binding protein [Rhodospirillales bacterium]|nr:ABC transporter substrate-binding protein [Rhodospirillales bacterium]